MSTQDAFDIFVEQQQRQGLERGLEQGLQQGREEGFAEAVLETYADRFGAPPPELSAAIHGTHDRAVLRGWLKLVATATAAEVLDAVRSSHAVEPDRA